MRIMKAEEFCENVKEIGFEESMQNVINNAVKKWTLWCFNYRTPFESVICQIWGGTLSGYGGRYYCEDNFMTQHLIEKWQSFANRGDARMLFFYCELDSTLRKQLVDWGIQNYAG